MATRSFCIRIHKIHGEKTISLARKLNLVDAELEVTKNKDFLYVPLLRPPSESELNMFKQQNPDFETLTKGFQRKPERTKSFVDLLQKEMPPYLLAHLPHAFDVVGDIAIMEVPPELEVYGKAIGDAVLKANKDLKTVLSKAGSISGVYRLRDYKVLAGEPKTATVHKEYGCRYYVDLTKAYFSPRLSNEHYRVASLTRDGETVVDLFAGVGPFAIQIAKKHKSAKVYAIDVNENAFTLLKKNIRLNRVDDRVFPVLGDTRRIIAERLSHIADRVIMNLPEKAMEFVEAASEALKLEGGIVHFYCFVNASDSIEDVKSRFSELVRECGREVVTPISSRSVRETAPYEWQTVLDAKIH